MDKNARIVVTGAAGFIGSDLTGYLNKLGYENLILVDEFNRPQKQANLKGKIFQEKIERSLFFEWLVNKQPIDFIFHLGARTDTTEFNYAIHQQLNVEYSMKIWNYCTIHQVPLIYASSAATYGSGSLGYKDDHALIFSLEPLNPYGVSKNEFDKWVIHQEDHPPFWAGLKFFNVYGPNEAHKGRMASVIWHSYQQILTTGQVNLFKSHRPDFADGQQLRDFIYVIDVLKVCNWLMDHQPESGLYNLGTGKARSFEDLVKSTFAALDKPAAINFIPMPEDIRDKYQYFTQAEMTKLKNVGYPHSFYSLEEGVNEYVKNYLLTQNNY